MCGTAFSRGQCRFISRKEDAVAPTGVDRLLAEMAEQPQVVARIVERQRDAVRRLAPLVASCPVVVLVGRGSSDHAAVYGRYLFETRNRLLTSLAAPSTVTLYGSGPRLSRAAVIAVSQSGQGEDVVAYVTEARRQGALTVALVNDATSPLARAAQHVLELGAGPELSIPATKTVIAQMALFALLSFELSGDAPQVHFEATAAALSRALTLGAEARALAQPLTAGAAVSIIGRGLAFPVALELALKLKETSDTRAEAFSSADFQHGPIALLDQEHPALLVDMGGRTSAPAAQLQRLLEQRGLPAHQLVVGPHASGPFALRANLHEALSPLVGVVMGQQLAVALAQARGLDPSAARGLSKVTSTR